MGQCHLPEGTCSSRQAGKDQPFECKGGAHSDSAADIRLGVNACLCSRAMGVDRPEGAEVEGKRKKEAEAEGKRRKEAEGAKRTDADPRDMRCARDLPGLLMGMQGQLARVQGSTGTSPCCCCCFAQGRAGELGPSSPLVRAPKSVPCLRHADAAGVVGARALAPLLAGQLVIAEDQLLVLASDIRVCRKKGAGQHTGQLLHSSFLGRLAVRLHSRGGPTGRC